MALTILFYSIFSGLTAFATEIWHVGVLRFLVAMGVGGEWAVGAALVAEVFPKNARERAGGIFHATSVAGLWLAAAVGLAVGSNWRTAYLIGVVPALLVLWVRVSIKEPEILGAGEGDRSDRHGQLSRIARRSALALARDLRRAARDGRAGDVLGRGHRRPGPRRRSAEAPRRSRLGEQVEDGLRLHPDGGRRGGDARLRPARARAGVASAPLSSCISRRSC